MGLYSLVSPTIFGRHAFVRLQLNEKGTLTIFPVGIEKVPRKWQKVDADKGDPRFRPIDREIEPCLIEGPIHVA